ncbi:HAMP domain-containing histidine kinase [Candidatus Woesebacteria bacterium]|nr:HAMP domain-containing histidine kinase [Candidatus Woesebacteria bacterium]
MFQNARIKLTAWYLIIIFVISVSFSLVIFQVLVSEVERFDRLQRLRLERRYIRPYDYLTPSIPLLPQASYWDEDLVEEIKARLILHLLAVNGLVVALSGILGYLLAGKTLSPIQSMVEDQHRFISDASHELKTPLTSLKIAFEVFLRDSQRTLTAADLLVNDSIQEVNRLALLSESLLQLSLYSHTPLPLTLEDVELVALLSAVQQKLHSQAVMKKITIKLDGKRTTLRANEEGLFRVFFIILDNAIKYSSPTAIITIKIRQTKSTIKVDFQDQGIGIAPSQIPLIFRRFYRADPSRTSQESSGYGLGLPIARSIIAKHHGQIVVKSTLGKGSTFTVVVPHAPQTMGI